MLNKILVLLSVVMQKCRLHHSFPESNVTSLSSSYFISPNNGPKPKTAIEEAGTINQSLK